MSFSLFIDVSGSVGGFTEYWSIVKKVYEENKDNIENYYFWDNCIEKVSTEKVEEFISKKTGRGGTCPNYVADEIVKKNISKIILLTDGEVSDSSVSHCDTILKEYKLSESKCYIISNSNCNMSVTCPFVRNCKSQVFFKSGVGPLQEQISYTQEDFNKLEELDTITLDNFIDSYSTLENIIIAQNMGKSGNIPLKNQIVLMKKRLLQDISNKMADKNTDSIRYNLETNNLDGALALAKKLTSEYFGEAMTGDLEKKINHLINLCGDLRGRYNIGQIKSNQLVYAPNVKAEDKITDLEVTDLTANPIECPVIMDQDVPQILVNKGEPILLGFEKAVVEDITACPLRILNYPEVKEKFKSRLSKYIGIQYSEYLEKNPFTKQELLGTIPLGTSQQHIDVGNYTLAKMLTGGKLLGNLNMYYAVIWYLVLENEIEYLKDIQKNLDEHLIYRLKNSKTMASLSGLAQFVSTKVYTDEAIWYVVNSGWLNQPTDRDTFRFHVFNMDPLVKMTRLLGYPIEPNMENHLHRNKVMMQMLSMSKRMTTPERLDFNNRIKGLFQNGFFVDLTNLSEEFKKRETIVSFVPADGPATEEQVTEIMKTMPKNFTKLTVKELVYLASLVDPSKSASDICLDYNLVVPAPDYVVDWAYGLNEYKPNKIQICPVTFRPFYHMKSQKSGSIVDWKSYVVEEFEVPAEKMIKGNKYYITFMIKYKAKPTIDEFVIYCYNRYILHGSDVLSGKKTTLPKQLYQFYDDINSGYNFITDFTQEFYDKFTKIYMDSMSIEKRIDLEKSKFTKIDI
jgi:hypothetical protein